MDSRKKCETCRYSRIIHEWGWGHCLNQSAVSNYLKGDSLISANLDTGKDCTYYYFTDDPEIVYEDDVVNE